MTDEGEAAEDIVNAVMLLLNNGADPELLADSLEGCEYLVFIPCDEKAEVLH